MTARKFSSGSSMGIGRAFGLGVGGAALTGLTYLTYLAQTERRRTPPNMQMTLFNPIVQDRVQKTFGYFSAACGGTAAFMYMVRNSNRLLMMNPWLCLGLTFGTLIGTHMCDYQNNWMMKNVMYAGFVSTMSISLLPLIHMYAMPVIFDALIATGVTVGALGAVAWNAPSEQFLNWGGPLALGLGGMMGISLLSVLYPHSKALYNMYLYGGLALFSAFLMYDTQDILYRAKTDKRYDPINSSIHVYMDAINLFVRFVQIFGNSKK